MATGGGGGVKNILSDAEFQRELIAAGEKLAIVNFFATWCTSSMTFASAFERLSVKYSSAVFIKVDADICRNTAIRYDVNPIPTFRFFKNREEIHQVKGANEGPLEATIIQHLGTQSEASKGEGRGKATTSTIQGQGENEEPLETTTIQHLGTQSETSEIEGRGKATITVPGQINLYPLIDHRGSECLNESDDHSFTNCLKPGSLYLESDCDEQLIIALAFTQTVKLHTLQFVSPPDGRAPKTVKLFINQEQTLDFDTAEQRKPVQEFVLTEEDIQENSRISLEFVKYQNVRHLTVFVQDNQGGEETTVLQYLGLFGNPLDTINMDKFRRVGK